MSLAQSQPFNQQSPISLNSPNNLTEKHENKTSLKILTEVEKVTKSPLSGAKTGVRNCHTTLSEKNPNHNVNRNHKLTEYFPVRRSVRKTKKTVMEEKQKNLEECVLSQREEGLKVIIFCPFILFYDFIKK